jgi:hypothetical protein
MADTIRFFMYSAKLAHNKKVAYKYVIQVPTNSVADEDDPFMSANWFQITSKHGAVICGHYNIHK